MRGAAEQELILRKSQETTLEGVVSGLFGEVAASLSAISTSSYSTHVAAAVAMLVKQFRAGRKVLIFGNGGSAADAQHISAELVGRFERERRGLPAIALASNPAITSALGNDYGFDAVFERQLTALGAPGDVAWGISTSGNSSNVVNALRVAREHGLHTIGLTGSGGGRMAPLCDVLMAAPSSQTPRIQEIHTITYHAICAAVENALFPAGAESYLGAGQE